MSGPQTAIVTGATSGIGFETARMLAQRGGLVIGVGRDAGRCAAARNALSGAAAAGTVVFETADLSSREDIVRLCRKIQTMTARLDVLVNNAGTFTFSRTVTPDGLEMQFAVNYLAGFLLTGLLLPLLRSAPAARIIATSSGSHFAGRMHWADLMLEKGYQGLKAYDQSKLATVLFTKELARRLGPGSTIGTYAVDPGLVKTDIGIKGNNRLVRLAWRIRTRGGISAEQAARSLFYCAVDPAAEGKTGLYWKECRTREPSKAASDDSEAARLWKVSQELCGFSYL